MVHILSRLGYFGVQLTRRGELILGLLFKSALCMLENVSKNDGLSNK